MEDRGGRRGDRRIGEGEGETGGWGRERGRQEDGGGRATEMKEGQSKIALRIHPYSPSKECLQGMKILLKRLWMKYTQRGGA